MSFRGRGAGRSPGGRGGGRFGGGRGYRDEGPPERVIEAGEFQHECEGEAIVKLTNEKVRREPSPVLLRKVPKLTFHLPQIPYFNAPIFLENKSQVGKVEEIFGKIQGVVRSHQAAAVSADAFLVLNARAHVCRCFPSKWLKASTQRLTNPGISFS